jgi:uncharacterized protein YjiS (DUF1127 family)
MTRGSVTRALRTQVAVALAGIALALRGWGKRAANNRRHRLRLRGVDRLSDHMLKDVGLSRVGGERKELG